MNEPYSFNFFNTLSPNRERPLSYLYWVHSANHGVGDIRVTTFIQLQAVLKETQFFLAGKFKHFRLGVEEDTNITIIYVYNERP